ncbi:hypothetical protein Tco_1330149 [Tanacetum coccineum]
MSTFQLSLKVCTKVFRTWDWTSNANLCSKGCRIIVGWNLEVVDVLVVNITSQVMHVKITHRETKGEIFCSFVYAANLPIERRKLWSDLDIHKNVVRGKAWVLLGDFNVALNLEDSFSSSSQLTSHMLEFKDCVENIEVMDLNCSGLHYTWNQKPQGGGGLLKKLDRVMGNIDFIDSFPVDGHNMYQIATKLKSLKKPFHRLLHEQGNLHDRVNRLRHELDEVQKALDNNLADSNLRDEEEIYLKAFNEAKLDEERQNQQSRIEMVLDAINVEVSGPNIPNVFVSHYEMFLGTSMHCDDLNVDGLLISDEVCSNMVTTVTNLEIKEAMFGIGGDICNAVRDFFSNDKLLKEINHSFIALIPKVSTPQRVVSENQSDFVPGRRIANNILITQELMHNYHRDWALLDVILKLIFKRCKRGLRQGDPLSPYLFTLVMEVLTLIIRRRVRLSETFHYHNHCEELQLVNVYFADDLFIFARGDVDSARVIMESLDEFKSTLGLVLSLPKSTTFFSNVCNHVKIAILNIMPFSEGKLPVKYLGVPLISSKLLIRDCKVLVEKATNRIGDWKNKSVSFAGRLQLCKSVISSLHVYWASVFILPKGIILDIQQLIRGFLWCNGEYKRGKAKALMTTHIWNIVSNKESLWVRWIHTYKLRGRSFWDIPLKADWDGVKSSKFMIREITNEGFNTQSKVSDLVVNNAWIWPHAWLLKARNIVRNVWEGIRDRGNEVPLHLLVWFPHCIPRHAFNLWLIMRESLKMQD